MSQMLLSSWVVSESGSGLEMQQGGDTYWRIQKSFWAIRVELGYSFEM